MNISPDQGQKKGSQPQFCPWPLVAPGIDIVLLLLVSAMVSFGLLMVYSASFIYAQERSGNGFAFIEKQFGVAIVGFIGLFLACRIPYRKWAGWAYIAFGTALIMLILVMVPGIGAKVGGAQRWIRLGFVSFQPGEIAKFAAILFIAMQLEKKSDRLTKFVPGVLSQFLILAPAFLLLLKQPDFGTTMIIVMVLFFMMFLAGVPKKLLLVSVSVAAAIGTWLVLSSPYRHARLMTFLDPWSDPGGRGFQVIQSMVGLHNGQFSGTGLGNGKEKLFYLPEAHNDFIFAVIGEELGFIGVASVMAAYLYFIYRGLKIASDCHQKYGDVFGALLAAGITLALGLQGFVNMAVVLGALPTKGLTLPFISYGGTALFVDLFAVGTLLSIARGPKKGTSGCDRLKT